ncbi:glycosyltransferase [Chelatococcus sp. SYSU_G07232]|uniref:Glycosyltransferase n=1 Tax=Chelatococcus albus TaxID=3047466 RepID=A0ABT7AC25_9HYPH|nr:glycosyltransferase [Chelatococcus sp. SYSU_G07232]MDJ1156915.1 glycosyltransferase [Chelatococcus sp. SYSU_G07232]
MFRHVLDVARGQVERGHEVGLVCDASTGGERADAALAALQPSLALGITRVPMSRAPTPSDIAALQAVRRLCRALRPDVIHGHGSKGGLYARLPAFLEGANRPVRVYTPHGGSFNYHPGSAAHRMYMLIERLLERRTDLFLFESAYVRRCFQTYVGDTDQLVRIVYNGIDEREFAPVAREDDPFDLLYIGELRAVKGIDTLIEALSLIRDRYGRALRLLLVGAGPEEQAIRALVATRGLASQVIFSPPRPIREALAKARVMVVPSRAESLPYVVLEAAAAAQPLVATDVGGIAEIFGPHGDRLIPPGDAERLAEALIDELDLTADERACRAAVLRAFVQERFSQTRMVEDGITEYLAAIEARATKYR